MTTNKHTMALAELAEKGADVDLLREMIQFVAQRLMELDVETLRGAGYGERAVERINPYLPLIVVHLHRPTLIPRVVDVSTRLADRATRACRLVPTMSSIRASNSSAFF